MTCANETVSFWEHFDELRKTVIRILLIITIGMLCSFAFYQQVFDLLTSPFKQIQRTVVEKTAFQVESRKRTRVKNIGNQSLTYQLPQNASNQTLSSDDVKIVSEAAYIVPAGEFLDFDQPQQNEKLIILSPSEGLMTALKTSFWVGLVATSPIWLFYILQFIAPALHSNERKIIFPFILFSLLFLSFGLLFSYFLTIPIANKYLNAFNQGLGVNFWTLSHYINYTVTLMLANALAFELFVVLLFLVHFKWISADGMIAKRKFTIVFVFILSAILTPPDILTQLMLAFPLIILYELTILYAKLRKEIEAKRSQRNYPGDHFQ